MKVVPLMLRLEPMVTPSSVPLLITILCDASVLVIVPFLMVPPLFRLLRPPVPKMPALPTSKVPAPKSIAPLKFRVVPAARVKRVAEVRLVKSASVNPPSRLSTPVFRLMTPVLLQVVLVPVVPMVWVVPLRLMAPALANVVPGVTLRVVPALAEMVAVAALVKLVGFTVSVPAVNTSAPLLVKLVVLTVNVCPLVLARMTPLLMRVAVFQLLKLP